ncbi:ABC transporter substrate-binding protein [Ohessyouella blattaphilus]|uniref:Extracellular solute-binding protein n=1 Tax=Ohessyouella blattaphilus TaxID=2949333 RepID=A0ABT1EKV4_9FIRM|nr:extracellular solute-binding protein [Ohessyouella blattaphilus]MCP1110296.1 extracellular solute-binding protein [Ohessyouella blattaphilus]MCR8563690.1 extracellular solute-binding protein [Ohessyouella blattaphilus]
MKKRVLAVVLCVAMLGTLVMGCGKKDDGGGDAKGDKEIYMFISQPEYADAIGELLEEYKKVAPDVTINYETTQNDYPTLLRAKLNSGDVPDIFSSTTGKEIEVFKEYSRDLSDQPLMEAMEPSVADTMKDANGEGTYGFAIKGNYFGMVYSKAAFEKAGIEKAPETTSELEDAITKLEAVGIAPFASGFAEWWVFKQTFLSFVDAAVPDYATFVSDMEKGEDSLANYPEIYDNWFNFVDLVKEHGDDKPLESDLSTEIASLASGKAAMILGQGPWVEVDLLKIDPDMEIGFTGYPVSDDAADAKIVAGSDQALRVSNESDNEEAVLDFINWWYTSDYGKSWFTDVAGVIPPVVTDTPSEQQIVKQGVELVEAKGAGEMGTIYSTDSFHTAFGEAMQAYVGGTSKDDTIKAIEQKWIEIDGSSSN